MPVPDGKLVILAADHPGRASLKIQDDPVAMADRHELLARILRVLSHPGIDGFMSTPDLVEDLLILAGLIRERGGQSPLDERLLLGCMNRGGLPGSRLGDGRSLHGLHDAPDARPRDGRWASSWSGSIPRIEAP